MKKIVSLLLALTMVIGMMSFASADNVTNLVTISLGSKPVGYGDVIKAARQKSGLTIEELANRLDISERYLYRIENEGKKPSFEILYNLIRELAITPDSIFYPERSDKDSEVENLIRRLHNCDERSLEVVKATVIALIDTTPK
mgnify:CR=1 FL=1